MLTPEIVAELRELAGKAQMQWLTDGQSWNKKDRAAAYLYRLSQVFYESVANGLDPEEILAYCDMDWRHYAAVENKKVENAPKFKRGPYAGQSARMDSWVYPDKFSDTRIHLRNMIGIMRERFPEEACHASE
jgi:hypothetical protein